jgi:hypothetical protein
MEQIFGRRRRLQCGKRASVMPRSACQGGEIDRFLRRLREVPIAASTQISGLRKVSPELKFPNL